MKHFFIILGAIILPNCSTQTQTDKQPNSESTSQFENNPTEKTEKATFGIELQPLDSSFSSFLIKFCANKEFQLTRINFPYEIKLFDYEDNAEIVRISKEEWGYMNLLDTAGIETREYDAYSQTIEVQENRATIQLRGIDNGIRIDYTFELRRGQWFLMEKSDSST